MVLLILEIFNHAVQIQDYGVLGVKLKEIFFDSFLVFLISNCFCFISDCIVFLISNCFCFISDCIASQRLSLTEVSKKFL